MRDVARLAGVTTATVSLTLRNSPLISNPTKERVRAAVAQLNYRPNPYVRALMRARRQGQLPSHSPVLAFATSFPTRDGWRKTPTPIFRQLYEGAKARAEYLGFSLQEFWLRERDMTPRRFSEMLYSRGIRGVLLAPLPSAGAKLELSWDRFCVVTMGFSVSEPALHRVSSDHFHSMVIAMEECLKLGYRRIGLALSASTNLKVQQRWLAAYLIKQRELPKARRLEALLADVWGKEAVRPWFEEQKPDVVIAPSPSQLMEWFQEWGLQVPRDIGVVNLSCPALGDPIAGIYQNAELLGARAVDLLGGLIERNEVGLPDFPNALLLDGTWNVGKTLKRAE